MRIAGSGDTSDPQSCLKGIVQWGVAEQQAGNSKGYPLF